MKRRKTYNKYDKSRAEVNSEPKILTEDEKKRKEEARKANAADSDRELAELLGL